MFELGATYSRRVDIHDLYGGQRQGGISTPANSEYIFLFTSAAGEKHGYHDEVTEEGFRLFGEGQLGSMTFTRGNRAVRDHVSNKKRLLLFQANGKGKRYTFRGEYRLKRFELVDGLVDTNGELREAIVFVLQHVTSDLTKLHERADLDLAFEGIDISSTTITVAMDVRTKQTLFRDRLETIESGCRVTGISDGRFLRASHIKPWSRSNGSERVDGYNGLLLAAHVDHLFDGGWLTFLDDGKPVLSSYLPNEVALALGISERLNTKKVFLDRQRAYLEYHRREIFRG